MMRFGVFATLGLTLLCTAMTPADAQSVATPFTSGTRYDAQNLVTGTIAPDPDGTGPLHHAASRNTYDAAGRLVTAEAGELATWQPEQIAPAAWIGFTVFRKVDATYDTMDRRLTEVTSGRDPVTLAMVVSGITQFSYDSTGRLKCTAVRMNPAVFASLPTDACVQSTPPGTQGRDRITRSVYDAAGQLRIVQKAFGTPRQQDYATYIYNANGKPTSITDANGNKASMTYDGFDRQIAWTFPSKANGAVTAGCTIGTVTEALENGVYVAGPSTARTAGDDCEKYAYDRTGKRMKLMKRDGSVVGYSYDSLDRVTVKTVPDSTGLPASATRDVYYGYDLRGRELYARFDSTSGPGITNEYDGFGRRTSTTSNMSGTAKTLSYQWDLDGNRTSIAHPDSTLAAPRYFTYEYDGLDRLTTIRENGTTEIASLTYNAQGQRGSLTKSGTVVTTYSYDPVSRLTGQTYDLPDTGGDLTVGLAYNPAGQIVTKTRSNGAYSFSDYFDVSRLYAVNGLNQYASMDTATSGHTASTTFAYDANGNLTSDGGTTYVYDVENRLVSASGVVNSTLIYDPLGRLFQASAGPHQFYYDGDRMVVAYNVNNGLVGHRYVHGPGTDEPIIWYLGASLNTRRNLQADHLGTIISSTNVSTGTFNIRTYDDYGIPNGVDIGRFGFTGQMWLGEIGLYYYKARMYSPTLGRFIQTDPIGYDDENNLYGYVSNDPVNRRDPSGERDCSGLLDCVAAAGETVVETAARGTRWARTVLGFGVASEAIVVTQSAWTIRDESQKTVRMTVYRVFDGTKAKQNGRSWTLDDPRRMKNWRDRLAVYPAWNDGTRVVQGTINMNDMTYGRILPSGEPGSVAGPQPADPSLGGGPYRGQGNEIIIPDARTTVRDQIVYPMRKPDER